MKTINSLFAVAVLGLSTILFASNAYAFLEVIPYNMSDKAVVKVVFPDNQNTFIYCADPQGRVILEETIKEGSSNDKIYNFSSVDNGIYTFHSTIENANTTIKIMVKNSSIEVISKEVEYKPVFIINDDRLLVSYSNLEEEEIEMVIYNSSVDFYNSTEGNSKVFRKKFDISGMKRGEYFAMLIVGGRDYNHSFNIY